MALPRLPTSATNPFPPSEPQRITITICGDGGTGKSSITLRLVRSQWTHEYDPTIEDSYSITRRIDGQTYHLSLTDTAGQEEYRGMWASSNLRSDAFLLVYDITNKDSLGVLGEFNDLIDIEWETRVDAWAGGHGGKSGRGRWGGGGGGNGGVNGREECPVKPVKIVAGNKCDLQESRQVPAREGLDWARRRGCGFMETSARNTVNIEETFALIVRRVVEARRVAALGGGSANAGSSSGVGGGGSYESDLSTTMGGSVFGSGPVVGMAGRRNTGMSLGATGGDGSMSGVGTRRAVTAPLSPLPGGPEKEMGFPDMEGGKEGRKKGKGGRFRAFFRGLACWR